MSTGHHVVVTGGASGIGAAVVQRLLARDVKVTVFDLRDPDTDAPGLCTRRVDVTGEAAVQEGFEAAETAAGPVTGVVTCHGIRGAYRPALDLEVDALRRVWELHVLGTLLVAREMVRRLDGSAGSVVTVGSTTGFRGWANQADYGVAKAAVHQLTANLAVEWAPLGVRVNCVAPGHTLTPMVQDLIDREGYDTTHTVARTPLGRLAQPDEVASAIEHLLLDATFVTGQCLAVDGGWTAVGK